MMIILGKLDLIDQNGKIDISNFKVTRQSFHEADFIGYIDGDYNQVLKDRYQRVGRDSIEMELFKKAIYKPFTIAVLKDRK